MIKGVIRCLIHNLQHYELKEDHVVGWRNYFDLKQAETGAHYVVVMENWRVESFSLSIYFLSAKSDVGVQESRRGVE